MQEVSATISLRIAKNGIAQELTKTLVSDMAGNNQISNVQTIGLAAEVLQIGDLANLQHLAAINLETSENPVVLSLEDDGTLPFAELKPGAACYFPLPAGITQVYAKATGGPADLAILACEA